MSLRVVVNTNEVHIIQTSNKTVSYGKDSANGNTYYAWPSWIPKIGITSSVLPTNNFELELKNYEAYDKGRLPLVLDIVAFFRICDSNTAAQRVASIDGLKKQLTFIVQGAARAILSSSDIEEIMQARGTFGEKFTNEVKHQLTQWGVEAVKNIELMDLRDANSSNVISNIMAKKKSFIEMESRTEVAENMRKAKNAELEAHQAIEMKNQEIAQQIGMRKVQTDREVALATQTKEQQVTDALRITTEKNMEVKKVATIKQYEIDRDSAIIKAEQTKQSSVIVAEGNLEVQKKQAEAIKVEGEANADAARAMQLAPVQAQIALAKEIGENEGYQNYLIKIKEIEIQKDVGMEQAKALHTAQIKIIANAGNPTEGLKSVRDMFSSKGGTQVAGMLEALADSDEGASLVNSIKSFLTKK